MTVTWLRPHTPTRRAEEERAACRGVQHPNRVAYQATVDARQLVTDVRDIDPREVWGRLQLLADHDPDRLLALTVILAAAVDPDGTDTDLWGWADTLTPDNREVA